MPRTTWMGTVSFGLVTIPVRILPGVHERRAHFRQLHQEDAGRIRYRRVCERDGEEVSNDEIVRGYEVSRDRFVLITDEELQGLEPQRSRSIDIDQFIDVGASTRSTTTPPTTSCRTEAGIAHTDSSSRRCGIPARQRSGALCCVTRSTS